MDLQTRKIEFIQAFLKLQSEEVITQFENLLKKKSIQEIEETHLKPMSIKEFNTRIDQSEEDFKNGNYKKTAELLKKFS
ncbi:MAG: hypothetical protein V4497_12350 [Bacteroidota bacterium]